MAQSSTHPSVRRTGLRWIVQGSCQVPWEPNKGGGSCLVDSKFGLWMMFFGDRLDAFEFIHFGCG